MPAPGQWIGTWETFPVGPVPWQQPFWGQNRKVWGHLLTPVPSLLLGSTALCQGQGGCVGGGFLSTQGTVGRVRSVC